MFELDGHCIRKLCPCFRAITNVKVDFVFWPNYNELDSNHIFTGHTPLIENIGKSLPSLFLFNGAWFTCLRCRFEMNQSLMCHPIYQLKLYIYYLSDIIFNKWRYSLRLDLLCSPICVVMSSSHPIERVVVITLNLPIFAVISFTVTIRYKFAFLNPVRVFTL